MQKSCKHCQVSFEVSEQDLHFYDRISPIFGGQKYAIPAPTLCPDCRWQRRLQFRNERTLYHRKSDLSGKSMISMHKPDTTFPVYTITEWQSDQWDPKNYGKDFDLTKPFFEQFKELCDAVPHFNLFVDPQMDVNSAYTNCSSEAKNCYLISQAEKNEDCYYSRGINSCKDCCDCLRVDHCELCYESINLSDCYSCIYSQDCDHCSDCSFSSNLRGCRNCFACHGLVQKEYYYFNQPLSKEEWEQKVKAIVWTPSLIAEMQKTSRELQLQVPQKAAHLIQCENSSGDHLMQCKNSHHVFDSKNLEECAYCYEVLNGAKYAYDFSMWGINCELLYECNGCGYNVYNVLFSNHCWQNVSNLLYCDSCFPSVKNCFGCFGLRRAEYCILNKQYSKEDYEVLVGKIIEHMQKTGEWGEFFYPSISPYTYEESLATQFFPLPNIEGGMNEDYIGPRIELPATIDAVDDSICQKILRCEDTNRLYKIIPQELRFYQKMRLPLPRKSPEERHRLRMLQRNPRRLFDRRCDHCGLTLKTTYAPDRPEKVYCDECYLKAVY